LAGELGVSELHLRRLEERAPVVNDLIALAPRLGLIARDLEAASRAASPRGARPAPHGFPRCVAPPERRALPAIWHLTDEALRPALAPVSHVRGCARCPGPPSCDGIPAGYHARFGMDLEASQPPIEVVRLRFGAPSRVICST